MISPRWYKVWRDLWSNRSRTLLVVMAIAIGVIAFGSVFATKEILLKDMTRQFQSINPASISINIPDGFDDYLVRWITTQPGVASARGVAKQMVRLYTPQGSRNLTLIAADYTENKVNRILLEQGTLPPSRQEMALERKSVGPSGQRLNDPVEVELPDGAKRTLSLTGIVHDYQAIPANMFPELTGYVNFSTFTRLGFPDYYTQFDIVTAPDITTKEAADILAQELKHKLEQKGYTSISVSAQKPGKHWGEDPTNAFVMILTIVGAFSLVLSVFLVINTISAVIAQQKKQIGIMKAVGGNNQSLMILYLAMTGTYGGLALLVAIPMGILLCYFNLYLVSNFLNLNVPSLSIPPSIIALEAVASLGVPLLAAAIPVYTGMRLSVREAFSDMVTGAKTNPLIDRITRGLPFLSRPTLLSLRNTFRKKTRLALTLVTLTIAGTLYMSVMSVQKGMMLELDNMLKLYNYDIELFFGQSYDSNMVAKQALKTEGVNEAETPKYAYGHLVLDNGDKGEGVQILGLNPDSNFMVATPTAGRWLIPEDKNQVVVSSKMVRDNPALRPGSDLVININDEEHHFPIVGVFMLMDANMIVLHDRYLSNLTPNSDNVNSVRVRTDGHTGPFLVETAKNLEQNLKRSGYNVAYSLTIDTIRSSSIGQFSFLTGFLLLMAALVAVVGGLSLAGTMSLNVLERTREIGVMRSIGASNTSIRSMVIVESVLIGFLSWLIAVPLSAPVGIGFDYAIGQAFFQKPLIFLFDTIGALTWLIIVLVIATIASLAPAARASKLTIRETLAYE